MSIAPKDLPRGVWLDVDPEQAPTGLHYIQWDDGEGGCKTFHNPAWEGKWTGSSWADTCRRDDSADYAVRVWLCPEPIEPPPLNEESS